jgi:hypothetical protein
MQAENFGVGYRQPELGKSPAARQKYLWKTLKPSP